MAQGLKVNISPSHLSSINSAKSGQQKLQRYRRYFSKDSVRQLRKLEKFQRKRWDSLTRATGKEAKLRDFLAKKGIRQPLDTAAFLKQYESLVPGGFALPVVDTALIATLKSEFGGLVPVSQWASLDSLSGDSLKNFPNQTRTALEQTSQTLPIFQIQILRPLKDR